MPEQRDRWQSRTAFIMAAVGSAIGLGNVWRFPGTAFQNGGGAFFIPYFIALLTAGIPLMIVEYGIGSRFQGSAAKAYRKLGKNYEWIGWWAVLVGLFISFYYCIILAWSWVYVWECIKAIFTGSLPWPEGGAGDYFEKDVAMDTGDGNSIGGFNVPAIFGLAATWIVVYFSIAKGVLRVGKIVMITVPLPLVLLVLLALRGLTLPGAMDGLAYYLAPDWSKLTDPQTWVAAYGQVFFSLSVGWGILIAYASYMPKKSDVVNNAYMTSFANCGFSFLAGFAVFSTLGYLGMALNQPIADLSTTSFGLAFTSYPTAVEMFPGDVWFQALIGLGFFLMLLTLGVDSAFSIVEAVATAMYDKFRANRQMISLLLCIGGFFMGLIYCTGSGLKWLDCTDKFLTDYGLTLVALVQCLLIGWFIGTKKLNEMRDDINARSDLRIGTFWEICLKYVTPIVLVITLFKVATDLIRDGYGGYGTFPLVAFGVIPAALVLLMAIVMQNLKGAGDED
ncbi:MAG: sodium-dependent transporter [Planctomycetota bacterium]